MSDEGFNFRPTERREAKPFEPPPWEADAFEEMARKKADAEAQERAERESEAEAAAAAAAAARAAEPPATGPTIAPPPQPAAKPGRAAEPPAEAPSAQPPRPAGEEKPATGAAVDDAEMLEMLAGLRQEEPRINEQFERIGMIAAFVTGLSGVVLLFWAMGAFVAGMKRPGPTAFFGGAVLAFFGGLLIVLAFWVGTRTLRRRGVI